MLPRLILVYRLKSGRKNWIDLGYQSKKAADDRASRLAAARGWASWEVVIAWLK